MNRRLRRAVFLVLLALGALGLLCTGSGVWQGSPWVWLAVLALAVLCQVAGDHYDQRLRLARRTERRLRELQEEVRITHRQASDWAETFRRDLDEHKALLTPEGVKHLHTVVQAMANDLKPIKEEWDSLRTAGGLKALLRR